MPQYSQTKIKWKALLGVFIGFGVARDPNAAQDQIIGYYIPTDPALFKVNPKMTEFFSLFHPNFSPWKKKQHLECSYHLYFSSRFGFLSGFPPPFFNQKIRKSSYLHLNRHLRHLLPCDGCVFHCCWFMDFRWAYVHFGIIFGLPVLGLEIKNSVW